MVGWACMSSKIWEIGYTLGLGSPVQVVLRVGALDVPARSAHPVDQLEVLVVDQIELDDHGRVRRFVVQLVCEKSGRNAPGKYSGLQ